MYDGGSSFINRHGAAPWTDDDCYDYDHYDDDDHYVSQKTNSRDAINDTFNINNVVVGADTFFLYSVFVLFSSLFLQNALFFSRAIQIKFLQFINETILS